jgi:hypothetical protein
MRYLFLALSILLVQVPVPAAQAQVGIGVQVPGLSIGINLPTYPNLVPVPGYPVYYAPQTNLNLFYYDGLYWVYQADNWYASTWYNGPWRLVGPYDVPLYVLRVPVRYYRQPPAYFRAWRSDAPPQWGEHWGPQWQKRYDGWDRWDRRQVPAAAPLPSYQGRFPGERYPRSEEQQRSIRTENYRYQPQERIDQQHFQFPRGQRDGTHREEGRGQEHR